MQPFEDRVRKFMISKNYFEIARGKDVDAETAFTAGIMDEKMNGLSENQIVFIRSLVDKTIEAEGEQMFLYEINSKLNIMLDQLREAKREAPNMSKHYDLCPTCFQEKRNGEFCSNAFHKN